MVEAFGGEIPENLAALIFEADPEETVADLQIPIEALARDARRTRMLSPPMLPDPGGGSRPLDARDALREIGRENHCDQYETAALEAAARLLNEQYRHIVELDRALSGPPKITSGTRLPGGLVAVPEVPTESMRSAGESGASFGIGKARDDEAIVIVWNEMLRAAGVPITYEP